MKLGDLKLTENNDGGFEALKLDDGRESGASGGLAYWKRLREEIE
ncbi:hypothetical protein A2U01_0117939, partial [Trifolium medium]|nr:hypothetical protein [Trifolium medium]